MQGRFFKGRINRVLGDAYPFASHKFNGIEDLFRGFARNTDHHKTARAYAGFTAQAVSAAHILVGDIAPEDFFTNPFVAAFQADAQIETACAGRAMRPFPH